jgi:hypothetical protein
MLSILLAITLCNALAPQAVADSLPRNFWKFRTTIVTNTAEMQTGYLYKIDDSTLHVTAVMLSGNTVPNGKLNVQEYKYADINSVKLKRHNSIGRGMLFGGLIGFGTGSLIGFASGDDSKDQLFAMTAGAKAIGLGMLMGTTGALVGLILGAVAHKKFIIGGNREKFQEMKTDLLHRANEKPAN